MDSEIESQKNFSFWDELANEQLEEGFYRFITADGKVYIITPIEEQLNPKWLGFAGRWFIVQLHNGRIVISNNVWHNGTCPELYKSNFHKGNILYCGKLKPKLNYKEGK